MEKTDAAVQKKKSRVGIVLLVLLLILAGAAGFLYYTVVKAPLALDDPEKMAASVYLTPGERFRFSSADQTVQVKLDAADLWFVILNHTGTGFLDVINQEISPYSLSVSGCAIHMDEEGLRLNLELYYKELRLVAKVPCSLEVSGSSICLRPTGVKLGAISLPVSSLLENVKLEYDFTLPVITEVTKVEFTRNAVVLTGPMGMDFQNLILPEQNIYKTVVFRESLKPLADALYTEEGVAAMMSGLEQEPRKVEDLYRMLFTLANPKETESYLEKRIGMTERFFLNIDFSDVAAGHEELEEQVIPYTRSLEILFNLLVDDYNDKRFKLSNGEFIKKGKSFKASRYGVGKFDELFEVLDPDSFFLILVDVENGFIRKTSSFYRMAKEGLEFTQDVNYNKTYILGCVFRSATGDPFLMYETEIHEDNTYARVVTLRLLTEEQVSALQVPGKFGVWTD